MPKKNSNHTSSPKPTTLIQVCALIALVALAFIDASFKDFEVSFAVYAIIAGVLFGIGNIKDIIK